MGFNLHSLIEQNQGRAKDLHEQGMNPVFSQVLEMIGFSHEYIYGQGATLKSADGTEYLDALSGYGVFGIGRNHPTIVQALHEALDIHSPNLVQMDTPLLSGLLAEKLLHMAPGNRLGHAFFTNSGTEAIEGALKFVRCATGRPRILYNQGAFHGLTTGALALNGDGSFREGFGDLFPSCEKVNLENLGEVELELKKGDVGAVFLEPVRGKGVYFPKDEFVYPALQKLCREHGVLFVVDEIQTGLGRTGKLWACEHWNLEPDILVTAKALSGGMIPIGAILYSHAVYKKVFSRLDRCVVHSSTFGQNALAMVAGLAALHVIEEEDLVHQSAQKGARLLSELKKIESEFIKEIRGKGLMIGIEFGSPKSLRLKPAWALLHGAENGLFAQAVVMELYRKHKILTQVAGHHQEVVKLLPPFVISNEQIDHIIQAFTDILEECRSFPGPIWSVGKQLAGVAARQQFRTRFQTKPDHT
ncbi:aminotransferase class III-fold pyridoxal phosphate-dependent enzyme [bacterium]|nr:aminotransferase class III-fold pyridoxal phosphate-dependent enzyme [bacterium]